MTAKKSAVSKNSTTATTKESKATSTKSAASQSARSKQDARARTAQTDPESIGIAGSKQQQALYRGGSLAQRRDGEGQLADAQSQSGNEVTSAFPPNRREKGKVSSPSFDEVPVSGKRGVQPVATGLHTPASLPDDIDAMEPGTSIEKLGGQNPEVRIRTAIAGGAIRIFTGATYADALEQLHKFLRGDALVLPTASDQERRAVADANEANVNALKGQPTKQGDKPRSSAAKKSSSKKAGTKATAKKSSGKKSGAKAK